MEQIEATAVTASTTELHEVVEFLLEYYWKYSDALVRACEPGTGKRFSFNFHFTKGYAEFFGCGNGQSPQVVEFDVLDRASVGEALLRMVRLGK